MTSPVSMILGLIVEGQAEVQAVPVLVRRVASVFSFHMPIKCKVRRVPKSQLLQPGELEKAVEALTRQIGRTRPLLVLLDADDDCPKDLAASLKARCDAQHADVTISFVIANKEYEAWFLAAARSLSGHRDFAGPLERPAEPESICGTKEWLTAQMPAGHSYSPTRHQSAYSELMDLSEARGARSFRKFEKELARLLKMETEAKS